MCYRCSNNNPLMNPAGNVCSICTQPFVHSFLSFGEFTYMKYTRYPHYYWVLLAVHLGWSLQQMNKNGSLWNFCMENLMNNNYLYSRPFSSLYNIMWMLCLLCLHHQRSSMIQSLCTLNLVIKTFTLVVVQKHIGPLSMSAIIRSDHAMS